MAVSGSIYDIEAQSLAGAAQSLANYRGKVLLVVNVASRCGNTPQYAGLEALYRKHKDAGLVVLGFPCNQFGAQEPGGADEIREFCSSRYDVTFPLFAKIDVNGPHAHPLYEHLKAAQPGEAEGGAIEWNFAKFLIDRDGNVVRRYSPKAAPEQIEVDIVSFLS